MRRAHSGPTTGIYGVRFTIATSGGGGPRLDRHAARRQRYGCGVGSPGARDGDNDGGYRGRVFTYSYVAFTGGNGRPVFHTLFYAPRTGSATSKRCRASIPTAMRCGATFRASSTMGSRCTRHPGRRRAVDAGSGSVRRRTFCSVAAFPIFFSTIDPAGPNATEAASVLTALGIPLSPASPTINNPTFDGQQSGNQTYVGGGGTFTFTASNDTSFQIVISADGADFDPANPATRRLPASRRMAITRVLERKCQQRYAVSDRNLHLSDHWPQRRNPFRWSMTRVISTAARR